MQIRKITALLTTTALVSGGGLGVAQAQSDSSGSTGTKTARPMHKGPGGGGPSAAQMKTLADTLGVSAAQLNSAFAAIRPAAPPARDKRGKENFAADIAKALGVETSAVKEILDANRPPRPATPPANGTAPPKPDHTKLIAALATGLNIDQDTVKTALDKLDAAQKADHDARDAKMAAALAKELGLDADKVAAALDASRPAHP